MVSLSENSIFTWILVLLKKRILKTLEQELLELRKELDQLRLENQLLREISISEDSKKTVIVPDEIRSIFEEAEENVWSYFQDLSIRPENGEITISGERYVLFKSSSLSYEFLDIIKELYSNRPLEEAVRIGNNFLFDIAHVLGKKDAQCFHENMNLTDPIQKLAAGPVHFAYTGWANVEILPESNPSPDEHYFLKYYHNNSFESQSWKKAGRKSAIPVCTMSCGYSSGWCEESYGFALTAVELECVASGAEKCLFVMAPPHKIAEYLKVTKPSDFEDEIQVPVFFEKKFAEDQLKTSIEQKDALLHELHHRVKNNLQLITSLLRLQMDTIQDKQLNKEFLSSVLRINTMAIIHEMVYSNELVSEIQIEYFFRHLFVSLAQIHHVTPSKMEIDLQVKTAVLDSDCAIPLGLMINEVIGYVFNNQWVVDKKLEVILKEDAVNYYLEISELSAQTIESVSETDLGMTLIRILGEQIDANVETIKTSSGLSYLISFKKATYNVEQLPL